VSKSAIFDFYHADIIRFNFTDHEVGLRAKTLGSIKPLARFLQLIMDEKSFYTKKAF